VSGDALLGEAVHLLGADLDFEGLAGVDDGGVERLVEVGTGHGDVVFEATGDGAPELMDDAEGSVTVASGIGDDADGEDVVDLVEGALLADALQMNGVEALDAAFDFGGDGAFDEFFADGVLNFVEEFFVGAALAGEIFLEAEGAGGLESVEGEVFKLATDEAHAEAMGDGSVEVEGLTGDTVLFFGREELQGAHVVEAVGKLDDDDADVAGHGQKHLADVFGLAGLGGEEVEAADLGDAFDEACRIRAELLLDLRDGDARVFDDVVEKGGAEGGDVEAHVGEDVGDLKRVGQERGAGLAELGAVLLSGKFVGAAEELGVVGGAILADLADQLEKASVKRAVGGRRLAARLAEGRSHLGIISPGGRGRKMGGNTNEHR